MIFSKVIGWLEFSYFISSPGLRMSFASRATFAFSCVATVGVIAYVHIEQALEREVCCFVN